MTISRNLDELLKIIAQPGATVVTSNTRAARTLRQAYSELQVAQGKSAWSSPDVVPWSAWLHRLWQEHIFRSPGEFTALLNRRQEQVLWERIVGGERGTLNTTAVAAQCARAWKLLHSYRIPRDSASFQRRADSAAFYEWSSLYINLCARNGWTDDARVLDHLHKTAVGVLHGRELTLWGFDSITPQQQLFLDAIASGGVPVRQLQIQAESSVPLRVELDDGTSELRLAATWARNRLSQEPETRIGIVVPDLERVRPTVERVFLEALHPEATTIMGASRRRAFEISMGIALSHVPVVNAALSVLSLAAWPQPLETISRILRTPFLGKEDELGGRAMLDVFIRKKGATELSLASLQNFAEERHGCGNFQFALKRLKAAISTLPSKLPPSRWGREILQLLTLAGWPGERTESSAEHQARRAFAALLVEFAGLDIVLEPLDLQSMVRSLSRLADETIFQPENLGAPLQVLGILESAGSEFDSLWIVGMHAAAWPPESSPSPFLPLSAQRAKSVPGSSPMERLQYARSITDRLLSSAPHVVVSSPKREGDVDLTPSPLFADFELVSENSIGSRSSGYERFIFEARQHESTSDEVAPAVAASVSIGGTRIFQLQAGCPFRAFAEVRLDAKELEMPAPGLTRKVRGILLHRSLELIWGELHSQNELKSKAQVELEGMVRSCVDQAMSETDSSLLTGWEQQVAQIERERLYQLLGDFLEREKSRSTPFQVKAREHKTEIILGGVTANVKVDRIDELEGGGLVLLDYKSGEPKLNAWTGDRPDEPQLPIYATHIGPELAAVAFVQLNRDKTQFLGYSRTDKVLPGVQGFNTLTDSKRPAESFEKLLEDWGVTLERLGRQFSSGMSAVDPKSNLNCERCHLHMLCRIHEAPIEPEETPSDAR
jgi:ATP-dependent helicase/nuclease subunit B